MTSTALLLKTMQKDLGDKIGSYGGSLLTTDRIPTGFFAFDMATGGGFPRGCTSIVYGPESSGKTNAALKAIAHHQLLWPDQTCVFVDVEHSFDPTWAALMGVDTTKLVVLQPDFAEQAVDMMEGFLGADDCGLIVLDSVGAMITNSELDKSASDKTYGGTGNPMSNLCRKIIGQMRAAEKNDRPPKSVIFINHLSFKIGVVFGNPMTMPGGNKQKFLSALTVRVSGKNEIDKKISEVMPIAKSTEFTIEKWKVPVVAVNGKFVMATRPHKGLEVGECDDWSTVSAQLKSYGLLVKGEKGGWLMYGKPYDKLDTAREKMQKDKLFGSTVRKALIDRAVSDGMLAPNDLETLADT